MPYIKSDRRLLYDPKINQIQEIKTKGDLEYCVYKLMKIFMKTREFRYSSLHDCVYAIQHCTDEFRRNYLDKREDEAKKNNGDVE